MKHDLFLERKVSKGRHHELEKDLRKTSTRKRKKRSISRSRSINPRNKSRHSNSSRPLHERTKRHKRTTFFPRIDRKRGNEQAIIQGFTWLKKYPDNVFSYRGITLLEVLFKRLYELRLITGRSFSSSSLHQLLVNTCPREEMESVTTNGKIALLIGYLARLSDVPPRLPVFRNWLYAIAALGYRSFKSSTWQVTAQNISLFANGLSWSLLVEKDRQDLCRALAVQAHHSLNQQEKWPPQNLSLLANGLPWELLEEKPRQDLCHALAVQAHRSLNQHEKWLPQHLSLLANGLYWELLEEMPRQDLCRTLAVQALHSLNQQEKCLPQHLSLLANGLSWELLEEKPRQDLCRALAVQAIQSLNDHEKWPSQSLSLLANGLPWELLEEKTREPLMRLSLNQIQILLSQSQHHSAQSLLMLFQCLIALAAPGASAKAQLQLLYEAIDNKMLKLINVVNIDTDNEERAILADYLLLKHKNQNTGVEQALKLYQPYIPQNRPRESSTIDLHGCHTAGEAFLFVLACMKADCYQAFSQLNLITGIGRHNKKGKRFVFKDQLITLFKTQSLEITSHTNPGRLTLNLSP